MCLGVDLGDVGGAAWVTVSVTTHGELVRGVCAMTESSVGVRWLRRMARLETGRSPVVLSLSVHVGRLVLVLLLLGVLHHADRKSVV